MNQPKSDAYLKFKEIKHKRAMEREHKVLQMNKKRPSPSCNSGDQQKTDLFAEAV